MLLPGELDARPTMLQSLTMLPCSQILKPAEKKKTFQYGGPGQGRPVTPPRKSKGGKGGK